MLTSIFSNEQYNSESVRGITDINIKVLEYN